MAEDRTYYVPIEQRSIVVLSEVREVYTVPIEQRTFSVEVS